MNITVYTVTFNEELIMQFMIDHYRSRFPSCHIVVYDNCSTDKTVEIAKTNGCEIRAFDSHGVTDNQMLWDTKNTCWKDADTDWVLVCDTDELLDINDEQLTLEDADGVTVIKAEAWQMVNMEDNLDIHAIKYGWRDLLDFNMGGAYDKNLLFNKKYVDVNYLTAGCHYSTPLGTVKNSKLYRMLHYKYINPDVFVAKQQVNRQRITENERKNSWGVMSLRSDTEQRAEFQRARNGAVKIL
jgi:glycosyltransferase involved in cell wall biosynthesis